MAASNRRLPPTGGCSELMAGLANPADNSTNKYQQHSGSNKYHHQHHHHQHQRQSSRLTCLVLLQH